LVFRAEVGEKCKEFFLIFSRDDGLRGAKPWVSPFMRELALPSSVFGPVDCWLDWPRFVPVLTWFAPKKKSTG
jgi:hypothetical protein